MAEDRDDFKLGVSGSIYTNSQKLIKGNTIRDKFLVLADSALFPEDADTAGKFLGIDATNSTVNISFIKAISPAGKFLKDDGTWAFTALLPNQSGQGGKFLITDGSSASWATILSFPDQSGQTGKFLTTNGSSVSWAAVSSLPGQDGHSGQFLTTNGSSASWATILSFPALDGNDGKFLTTDGSSVSWATVSSLPGQDGNEGKFLTTNGSSASWATILSFPALDGNDGKFLTTDGSSVSWADITCVCTPGGSDGAIQFNYSGEFTGSEHFTWEEDDRHFKVDGTSLFGMFDVALAYGASTSDFKPTALVDILSAGPVCASLRIRPAYDPSMRPTSPLEGDIWNDGESLWIHIGGADRQFKLT